MKYDAVVTNLPISVRVGSDTSINSEYVTELGLVTNEVELETFTNRWKMLWKLPYGENKDLSDSEESIINNTYDKKIALDCINAGRSGVCDHIGSGERCAGADILIPALFLKCFLLAEYYVVPFNVALVQFQKALGNLPDEVGHQIF